MTETNDHLDRTMDVLHSMHSRFFAIGYVSEALLQGVEDGIVKADAGRINELQREAEGALFRMVHRYSSISSQEEAPTPATSFFESIIVQLEKLYESTADSLQGTLDKMISLKGDAELPNIDRALARMDEPLPTDTADAVFHESGDDEE